MSNARLMIKMRDGQLAWTERHWYWPGVASGSPPYAQATPNIDLVVAAAKVILPLRKLLLNGTTSTMIGAVVSMDDSDRDGYPIFTDPYPYNAALGGVVDPEISVMISCRSNGNLAGPSYTSQFYMAPVEALNTSDQQFLNVGAFATALFNYLDALKTVSPTPGWGWKAVTKNPPNVPLACTNVAITYPGGGVAPFMTLSMLAIPAGMTVNSVVRLSGIVQGKGGSPRLNGRWYVADITGLTVTLNRKYWPNYTSSVSVNRIGNTCSLTPSYFQIVPYTSTPAKRLVKRDRGGTLGLSRGRSRGSRAYV